jgi:chemotaxis protein MotB
MSQHSAPSGDVKEGAPAWVTTFADLMSLLMCFFVLLLSFSEMDAAKFKELAGSLKMAFGIQRDLEFKKIPKGTSIITQEFSPGKPTPTPIKEMRQQTTDETKDNLDFTDSVTKQDKQKITEQLRKEAAKLLQKRADKLSDVLKKEIGQGLLEIKAREAEIMIRIREKGSFPSGSARLQRSFLPILEKIGKVLKGVDGKIIVAGHSDNVPISTPQYPSNWLLSAARSATVVHFMTQFGDVSSSRIQIRAHADTLPVAPNNSSENRAKNRRVDIIVQNGIGWLPEQQSSTSIAGLSR